jgi:hypothetical protein
MMVDKRATVGAPLKWWVLAALSRHVKTALPAAIIETEYGAREKREENSECDGYPTAGAEVGATTRQLLG